MSGIVPVSNRRSPSRAIIGVVGAGVDDYIAEGRTALRRGDGRVAREAFEAAATLTPTAEALEGAGQAAYVELDFERSVPFLERAYAAYRDAGDGVGAIRTARILGYLNGAILGDGAVMAGWLARAQTLLDEVDDCAERGWVALSKGMFEDDRPTKDRLYREAVEVARRFDDTDLLFVTLAYLGASLVHGDRTEEGMLLLDEACAAAAGHDVENFSLLEEIFCQLFSACEYAHDVERADQWIRIGLEIASRRNLPAVAAFCRTHYGGILTVAGRWGEADEALTEAVRQWSVGYRGLKAGALVRLADLRVRQGRFEEAEQLLDGLDLATEAARPLAGLLFAKGETARAAEVLGRALAEMDPSGAATGPLLSLSVDIELARGNIEGASLAAERLDNLASKHAGHYLRASAALARGRLCLATGSGDPRTCLREAMSGFSRAQVPMELAQTRMELAAALTADSPEVAIAEARAALEAFEKLQAARDADAAAALLRKLGGPARTGPKTADAITKREAEVLELLRLGLTNAEISDRLFISPKTVEHHVGRILAKLGLKSRAQAAAYASRTERPAPR